jgi:hypothetical protein
MRCNEWFARRVVAAGELDAALAAINEKDCGACIEVLMPEAESRPLSRVIID